MKPHKKRCWIIAAVTALLLTFLLTGDTRTRMYVRSHIQGLEDFAVSALEKRGPLQYGAWDVFSYPEGGMVEFYTGGYGLVPSTVYKGFYYSAADAHTPFQATEQPMEVTGDTARWQQPESDNWGTSRRIAPHWFWYEAHF